jgi:cytochrome b561
MKIRNDAAGWGLPARLLHWSMALLIIGMLAVGWYMVNALTPADLMLRFRLTQTHKSFGFVVFALALARIVWRLVNPAPAEPPGSALEHAVARWAHRALYALMLILPLTGWLMASASPLNDAGAYPMQIRNMVFGLFEMPDPIAPGSATLEAMFKALHLAAAVAMAALLVAHAGAALFHHLVRRDRTLARMVSGA